VGNKFEELLGPGGSLTRKLHDILASHDHVVQLISFEATRSTGRSSSWNVAAVMHIRDGKISEDWLHIEDPYAVDNLFA
jgi:ketosteroid isomerase-like protein